MGSGSHTSHARGGHEHGVGHAANRKRLTIVLVLAGAYAIAEVIGGLMTNSLALLADAGHMFSDVAALALALFAIWIAQRPPSPQHSYGYYRSEILAALVNGATLVAISLYIFVEAYQRLKEPPEVQGGLVLAIAAGGLAMNLIGLRVLSAGRNESLNVRGAWLHVLTDALGSVGAMLGGLAIWWFGWYWADPVASVLIGLLVIYSSWALLKEAVAVLMEGAPGHIKVDEVRNAMVSIAGVTSVHDLHVWSITSGMVALSGHVSVSDHRLNTDVLTDLRTRLRDGFGIDHATIQIETEACAQEKTHE